MNATDASVVSITDSLRDAVLTNLSLEQRLEQQASTYQSPEEFLMRMLSIKSVVSTTSSFAATQEAAVQSPQRTGQKAAVAKRCAIVAQPEG